MNNKILVGAGLTVCALGWAAKDPVIMNVAGIDVPKSEFEYLYHKNSKQQLVEQPLDEYVEMFKIYKLKVADAKAEGIDTTKRFRDEITQYRHELAAPYLADSVFINGLVKESFLRSQEEVEANHIMLLKTRNGAENAVKRQRIDSIRKAIVDGADFADMARKHSEDRSAQRNGGSLGYIVVNHYPYSFESAAYTLKEGELSDVVESPVGYHLLKGGKHRKARGQASVEHIMKMVSQPSTEEADVKAKNTIDSIYNIVKGDPSKFEELAFKFSDDKGSGRQGGKLPPFGAGDMVPEFDEVSFALAPGEISEPFRTQFGWHIVKKLESIPVAGEEELKAKLLSRMGNPQDERYRIIRQNQINRFGKKHGLKINDANIAEMRGDLAKTGLDSVFFAKYLDGPGASAVIATMGKNKTLTAGELMAEIKGQRNPDPRIANDLFEVALETYLYMTVLNAEEDDLMATNADYRNLYNEYVDGSLLYEVSVQKVWDKASKDKAGVEAFFNRHRGDYTWKEPHVKGILVQAVDDSVANLVRERMKQLGNDTIVRTINKEFPKRVQLDRVLVPKGGNQMVDYLMFGGDKVKPSVANFTTFFLFEPKVLEQPEEAADVKGLVTSDYQNELEALWVEELKGKYPVSVDSKVLKKVK